MDDVQGVRAHAKLNRYFEMHLKMHESNFDGSSSEIIRVHPLTLRQLKHLMCN